MMDALSAMIDCALYRAMDGENWLKNNWFADQITNLQAIKNRHYAGFL
jgi:hypothetical protein